MDRVRTVEYGSRVAEWSRVVPGLVVLLAASAASAQTYECTPAPEAAQPVTQVWHRSNRCVPLYIDRASSLFDGADGTALVQQSAEVWTRATCTDLELPVLGFTDQRPGFNPQRDDNLNVISEVLTEADRRLLPDPSALATTVTFHNAQTGEIFDADILFNTRAAQFEDVASNESCMERPDPPHDLRNTLVHELGHLIGFDHNGDRASTMFASAPVCETSKRDLTPTDLGGLCDVYAARQPSRTCRPADDYGSFDRFRDQCAVASSESGGCRSVPAEFSASWVLGLVALALARRRLSERRTSRPLRRS